MPNKRRKAQTETAAAARKRNHLSGDTEFKVEESDRADGSSNESPVLVFAHGAGAPSTSDWMVRWKDLLRAATNAVEVVTFDYPYLAGGKRGAPPKAEKLVDFHLAQVNEASSRHPGHPVVLVGKSMGSRVSCMVAARGDTSVAAVICLGYPLKGMNGALRDETLLQLSVPVMFVQGSKDSMCPLDELDHVRKSITPVNELHVIEGGDHSFKVGKLILKGAGTTQEETDSKAVKAVGSFVQRVLGHAQ